MIPNKDWTGPSKYSTGSRKGQGKGKGKGGTGLGSKTGGNKGGC